MKSTFAMPMRISQAAAEETVLAAAEAATDRVSNEPRAEPAPIFSILQPEHVEAATECLSNQFGTEEAMMATMNIGVEEFRGFAGIHCARTAANGGESQKPNAPRPALSTVATIDGEVAAVCISEDLTDPLVPEDDPFYTKGADATGKHFIDMNKWGPVLTLVFDLEKGMLKEEGDSDKEQGPSAGEYFHQFMVAVSPKFQKRGLCRQTLEANLAMAKELGFQKSVIECTGKFSHSAAVKLGYVPSQTIVYKEFEMHEEDGTKIGEFPFAKTEEMTGHDACIVSLFDIAAHTATMQLQQTAHETTKVI